jgi:hypothetical protein
VRKTSLIFGLFACACAACVPPGNATPDDAGVATSGTAAMSLLPKNAPNVLTTPFEDNFDRPDTPDNATAAAKEGGAPNANADASTNANATAKADASANADASVNVNLNVNLNVNVNASTSADAGADAAAAPTVMRRITEVLPDGAVTMRMVPVATNATPDKLGPNWTQAQTNAWHIEDGWLCVENAHNHGVWFSRPIPVNARIEFDAKSDSPDGDLKAEFWGDGRGFAKGTSYNDATSYLAILGGWKNTLHVLARLDEHKDDRKAVHVDKDSDDPRQRPVMRGQVYHFKVERNDGKTVRYYVDGLLYATFADNEPLVGIGHDHFGFNDWEAKVCFDNVKITPLP